MKLLKPNPACAFSPVGSGDMTFSAIPMQPAAATESLMPYESVAKTMFVKANDLPAYYKATGAFRYAR